MNSAAKTILIAAGVIAVFVAGILIGFFVQQQRLLPDLNKFGSSLSTLSSPAVTQIMAFGKVSDVSGNTISIVASGQKTSISINAKTAVQTYVKQKTEDVIPRAISLNGIQPGQFVNILLKVLPSGDLQALSVSVMPVAE